MSSGKVLTPPPIPGMTPSLHRLAVAGETHADDGLPRKFAKYTLLRKLATGGMAELFLALQKSVAGFEKLIVIKRVLPQMVEDRSFIDMLLQEARIAATLSHPNIVQIYDVGEAEGSFYIAMEHIHGEDIRSVIRQMRAKDYPEFPVEHALAIALGVCAGLNYAHEKKDLDGHPLGIVHRDISPQNVLMTFSGDIKIVDFGIAKSDTKMITETKSGRLKGKVPYMSPEQARGEKIDGRSDIFSAGVMLFELTTGRRLFKGQSEFETLKLICDRDYPLPSSVRSGYPPALESIVMKALAKDPTERYQTARQMQNALEEFIREERVAVSSSALQQFMQSLFEDKLASQQDELNVGRQAVTELERVESMRPPPVAVQPGSTLSMPAAARTVTGVRKYQAKTPLVLLGGAALVLGIGVGVFSLVGRKKIDTVAAQVVLGSVTIESDPEGAEVVVDGTLRADKTPVTVRDLPLDRKIDITIRKEGFAPERQTVELSAERPTLAIRSSLREIPVIGPSAIAATALTNVPVDRPHSSHGKKPLVHTDDKRTGRLNVDRAGGWCNVAIDGAGRGATPIAGIELSAGTHKVTCTTADGKAESATVTVPADGTARYKFSF